MLVSGIFETRNRIVLLGFSLGEHSLCEFEDGSVSHLKLKTYSDSEGVCLVKPVRNQSTLIRVRVNNFRQASNWITITRKD